MVAAEARELECILRRRDSSSKLPWPLRFARAAEINGVRMFLAAHGHGPRLAGEAADVAGRHGRFDAVVSAGYCGALDPGLEVGDIVVASQVQALEQETSFVARVPVARRPYAIGPVLSLDRVVQTAEEKQELRASGASVVEMEAAAVASRAQKWGIPFLCVRVVTDRAGDSFALDFNAARGGDGRIEARKVLKEALKRPWTLLPELFALRRNARRASQALGDFIAECRF